MSDNGSHIGIFVSIGSMVASVIAFITFWTRLSDRITIADQKADRALALADQKADKALADRALQEAAEAKNEVANLREAIDEFFRTLSDRLDQRGREYGDGLTALRAKLTEVELFMRDHFVRQPEFTATMSEIKEGVRELNKKVDRMVEQRAGGKS